MAGAGRPGRQRAILVWRYKAGLDPALVQGRGSPALFADQSATEVDRVAASLTLLAATEGRGVTPSHRKCRHYPGQSYFFLEAALRTGAALDCIGAQISTDAGTRFLPAAK